MRSFQQQTWWKRPSSALFRWVSVALMVTIAALCFSLPAFAQTKYVITDGDNVIVCMSTSNDPQVVIQQAGLELGESDTYTTQKSDGVSQIMINRVQMICVEEGSEMSVVGSYGGTVADVLASLDITLSPSDVLSCPLTAETYDGMNIHITRRETETITYEEPIPFSRQVYEDDSLTPGEEQVLVPGVDGVCRYTAEVVYEDGVEVSRDILSQQILTAPTDETVLVGVDRSLKEQVLESGREPAPTPDWAAPALSETTELDPSVQYIPGTAQPYRYAIQCTASAYTCESPSGVTTPGTTFSGTPARVGAIAVDPDVIPLGSKLYIVTNDGEYVYGYCTAEDTGSAIQGYKVDLYYDSYDFCMLFGRREATVYVIE